MIIASDMPKVIGNRYDAMHSPSGRIVPYVILRVATYDEWLAFHKDHTPEERYIRMAQTICTYFYEVSVD